MGAGGWVIYVWPQVNENQKATPIITAASCRGDIPSIRLGSGFVQSSYSGVPRTPWRAFFLPRRRPRAVGTRGVGVGKVAKCQQAV